MLTDTLFIILTAGAVIAVLAVRDAVIRRTSRAFAEGFNEGRDSSPESTKRLIRELEEEIEDLREENKKLRERWLITRTSLNPRSPSPGSRQDEMMSALREVGVPEKHLARTMEYLEKRIKELVLLEDLNDER